MGCCREHKCGCGPVDDDEEVDDGAEKLALDDVMSAIEGVDERINSMAQQVNRLTSNLTERVVSAQGSIESWTKAWKEMVERVEKIAALAQANANEHRRHEQEQIQNGRYVLDRAAELADQLRKDESIRREVVELRAALAVARKDAANARAFAQTREEEAADQADLIDHLRAKSEASGGH